MPSDDVDVSSKRRGSALPDPHGQAALLLVESLIHGLLENVVLSTKQVIEIADRAASVQFDQAEALDGAGEPMWKAHELLLAIIASLRTEDSGESVEPRSTS